MVHTYLFFENGAERFHTLSSLFIYIFQLIIQPWGNNHLKYVNEQRRKCVELLCFVFEKENSLQEIPSKFAYQIFTT